MSKDISKLFGKSKGNFYAIDGNKGARTVLITGASGGLGASLQTFLQKTVLILFLRQDAKTS